MQKSGMSTSSIGRSGQATGFTGIESMLSIIRSTRQAEPLQRLTRFCEISVYEYLIDMPIVYQKSQ